MKSKSTPYSGIAAGTIYADEDHEAQTSFVTPHGTINVPVKLHYKLFNIHKKLANTIVGPGDQPNDYLNDYAPDWIMSLETDWWTTTVRVKEDQLRRPEDKLVFAIFLDDGGEKDEYYLGVFQYIPPERPEEQFWSFSTTLGVGLDTLEDAEQALEKYKALARMRLLPQVDLEQNTFSYNPERVSLKDFEPGRPVDV